ncbi:hypothetical protein BGZ96_004064, partial [Linnemannia gamsii]
LPWLKVFEARRIKGNSDRWDWSPFSKLSQLEELLLWRNEKPMQTFSLSEESMIETPDDVYPEDGINGGFGGFVQLSNSNSPMLESDEDEEGDDNGEVGANDDGADDTADTEGSVTGGLEDGDSIMRSLVSRVTTFLYWNSFNILFPVVRTKYERLVNLILVEPCEPAWREGTWQEHAAVFHTMKSLETITWINPHMQRRYLIPILDVLLLSLDRLRVIRLVSTGEDTDTQVLQMILTHVLETRWTGQLTVSIQDDLGADPLVRDWCTRAEEAVRVANLDDAMKNRPLVFTVGLLRSEWDEDAGLKRLCLKAWQ